MKIVLNTTLSKHFPAKNSLQATQPIRPLRQDIFQKRQTEEILKPERGLK